MRTGNTVMLNDERADASFFADAQNFDTHVRRLRIYAPRHAAGIDEMRMHRTAGVAGNILSRPDQLARVGGRDGERLGSTPDKPAGARACTQPTC